MSVQESCPLCGEVHDIPDARSNDPIEMGCYDRGSLRWAISSLNYYDPYYYLEVIGETHPGIRDVRLDSEYNMKHPGEGKFIVVYKGYDPADIEAEIKKNHDRWTPVGLKFIYVFEEEK
jgi:hypothetical protein